MRGQPQQRLILPAVRDEQPAPQADYAECDKCHRLLSWFDRERQGEAWTRRQGARVGDDYINPDWDPPLCGKCRYG
jgi:hypothetical protein